TNYYAALLLRTGVSPSHAHLLKRLHCRVLKALSPFPSPFLPNALISAYARALSPAYARRVFDQIPHPNLHSWNALLSALSRSSALLPALSAAFLSMPSLSAMSRDSTVAPSRVTFSTMLVLSTSRLGPRFGRQIHCRILRSGLASCVFVASPLVDMYSKSGLADEAKRAFDEIGERNVVAYNTMITGLLRCGAVGDAKQLFDEMPERDSVSWTAVVAGLAQNGLESEAVDVFGRMRAAGVGIDQYTFGSVLAACGGLSALDRGKQIHAYIIRTHYQDNIFVGSALVDMYSKCRCVGPAESVFRKMPRKNIVSWTAMLVGYGQNGCNEEALRTFCEMEHNGIEPDDFTLGSVISSCANLASLEEGTQFHCRALVSGLISYLTVSNAIVTLYGKCGSIEDSHRLFDDMRIRDQVSWTALVSGYAQFGKAKETVELFEDMLANNVKPDGVTFIGVLSACSRAGLVEKGRSYFDSMVKDHGIVPITDHYTCMIDLFSRAGRLNEAEEFIKGMPCQPDAIGWATLLSSCRLRGNIEIGKWAAENLLETDPQNPASYVLLSSMYAAKGQWDEVSRLRRGMRDRRVKKEPGCSWIKYKNEVHIFSADDQSHPYSKRILEELDKLMDKMIEEGYKPDMSSVLHDVGEAEKIQMLGHHSEKLAIAFGLVFIPKGMPIRVVKNLRVCGDCHNATKFISKISGRDILVRDSVRFHKFSNGECSCGDFW
ncbi:putative pentatricopeptide repeat-containing protein At1g68930, partial [Ananas comosus]|uniref:Pentatricopeptide repeat-containing protein At1g68930 n=1 Tax=Ananas comosus TaxID=4615 RepID=A0A6P5H734_ANACO